MKKHFIVIMLLFLFMYIVPNRPTASAQLVLSEVIKAAIKKVVKAMDLKVQRLQNKTIWLQQTQKTIENLLSKTRLDEIAAWSFRQRETFASYYESLMKVKSVLVQFNQVKEIIQKQVAMVGIYQRTWNDLKKKDHFTAEELHYMAKVYAGILAESLSNVEELTSLVSSYSFQMSDGERMKLINVLSDRVEDNYQNLLRFNRQNSLLSLQRSKSLKEVLRIKKLHGIPDKNLER